MKSTSAEISFDPRSFLKSLTTRPGVYRMLDAGGKVLYVGKARNLKRRVGSYFNRSLNLRMQQMVARIRGIEVTVTHTEAEALILENNLIKRLKPRYNILLRDDKSYPYIHLSADPFPRLSFHRGARKGKGRYFGPYPNGGSSRATLQLLQKLFPVRQCEESFYRNRSRPCLQYQIRRCSAPCVGLVTEQEYARAVQEAVLFLEGKTSRVIEHLVTRMEQAAADLEYEEAARLRDRIARLRKIQERQYVSGEKGDLDLVACAVRGGSACIQLFSIRHGRNLGNKPFFPQLPEGAGETDLLAAFLGQHYPGRPIPKEIIVSCEPEEKALLQAALSAEAGHAVAIRSSVRGERARWLRMARQNAELALEARLASRAGMAAQLEALQQALALDEPPERIECFDISHTGGQQTVASCVVFDSQGAVKRDYRRFNIQGIQAGDDYAAMEQALLRRYQRLQAGEGKLPDLLLLDGGAGQLAAAERVLRELAVNGVVLLGVAKGADRRPGMERLFLSGQKAPIILSPESPALHLIQQVRDEAHRFAISGHRRRREQHAKHSPLEGIAGIGPKRRQQLLKQFGGLQELAAAGVEDLVRVEGISRQLAEKIYDTFHGND
jgi:excinuclease ABC subunit C